MGLSCKCADEDLHVMKSRGKLIVTWSQSSRRSCSWLLKLQTILSCSVKDSVGFGVTKMDSIYLSIY